TAHADGIFTTGEVINIDVDFAENVALEAGETIRMILNSGATIDRNGPIAATTQITFVYTVGGSDNAADLDVTSMAMTAGQLQDETGNNANFTLPTGANSLGGSAAIVIDTGVPTIASTGTAKADGTYNDTEAAFDINVVFS